MINDASQDQINEALEQAYTAFLTYRNASGATKATFLRTIAEEIEALGDELIQTAKSESNLPDARLMGERGRTCMQLRQMADAVAEGSIVEAVIETAIPDRQPLPKVDLRNMLVPIGPVVVFGASNFPFAFSTAGVDPAAAWAAGCSVVVKAHPGHPKTSTLVAAAIDNAIARTGLPKGVFQHLYGTGFEVGKTLVMHPRTAAVGFTGSLAGGRALLDYASQRTVPIPVFAEMGSTNPVFLLPDAMQNDAEKWGKMYAGSITGGMGQFCTKPGLIIGVAGEALERFSDALAAEIRQTQPSLMLHQGIAKAFRTKRAEVMSQSEVIAETTANCGDNDGIPSVASVSGQEFMANCALHQEVFGPFSLLIKCADIAEVAQVITHLEGQLTCTIIASDTDLNNHSQLLNSINLLCGRIIINGVPTGVEVCAAMQHGGPYPASTDGRFGSVGVHAMKRFMRPLAFQNFPDALLPDELKSNNPLNIWRLVDGQWTK